ncbi:MAG: YitT family protein [Lachnospiraceae bacterium]|nr:YitT family protein [Lachnospiraceae bacterium]
MKKSLDVIKEFGIITIASAIVAASDFFFLVPSNVPVGSIIGLAIVLTNFIPLSVASINMIINVALLMVGFLLLGREFGVKTIYTSILIPGLIGVYEAIFPNYTSIMGDPFLDVICSLFLLCFGQAILFQRNASSGGLDIVAKLMNKFLHMDLGRAMSTSGMLIALSSMFVSDAKIVVLSVLGTYLSGVVLDYIIFGFDMKKRVCIISKKQEEIRAYILNEIQSGATVYEVYGAYNMDVHKEIVTIVDKNEYAKLMSFIEKNDKEAFITVYSVNKAIYRPKNKNL